MTCFGLRRLRRRVFWCAWLIAASAPALSQVNPNPDAINSAVGEFFRRGRYAEGLSASAAAVDLIERLRGPNDPGLATALANYGRFLVYANRAPEAESIYRRALAIDEAAGDAGKGNVSRDLNNLADLLHSAQRNPEAEQLYLRALDSDEHTLGPDHRDVARDLNNIAILLQDQGKDADAESVQRRAIAILEKLQRENPAQATSDLASALSNLATSLSPDRVSEAEALYRRALELNENEFGTEHPYVAVNLNNLAEALRISGKYEEAEALLRRALSIDERVLGPQHPTVATLLNNLAKVLRDTNRPSEAESLFNRALSIDRASFGPKHPTVARDLKNIAKFYKVWNRSADAEPLIEQVIEILEDMGRKDGHPNSQLGPALNFHAQLLADTNQLVAAEARYRDALAVDEKTHGSTSIQVARDMRGLSDVLSKMNRSDEALALSRRANEIAALAKPAGAAQHAVEADEGI